MALSTHVAIIGAGPYGLSAAAYLRAAGVECALFGEPMGFWTHHTPPGLRLRLPASIADPACALGLAIFERRPGVPQPLNAARFAAYGRWYQRRVAPDLVPCRVVQVEQAARGFRLVLEDGSEVMARRVLVAAGAAAMARQLPVWAHIPPEHTSHSTAHTAYTSFCGQRVVVVGSGQSALESAAFLQEAGAEVELVARNLSLSAIEAPEPRTGWGCSPQLHRWLPGSWSARLHRQLARPAVSGLLRQRLAGVRLTFGRRVRRAELHCGQLRLRLCDGSERRVDHAIVASGFCVNLYRYRFLPPALLARVETLADGSPKLGPGLESTLPGLHFTGLCAAATHGPAFHFLLGTSLAGEALAKVLSGKPVRHSRIIPQKNHSFLLDQ